MYKLISIPEIRYLSIHNFQLGIDSEPSFTSLLRISDLKKREDIIDNWLGCTIFSDSE